MGASVRVESLFRMLMGSGRVVTLRGKTRLD